MLVKDRAASGIGASTLPRVWHSIDWKATAHRVRNLRRRIYRASQLQQPNRVHSLMKLMLRSRANLYAAVRRVTQDNPGKRTPGVDGQLAHTTHLHSETEWQNPSAGHSLSGRPSGSSDGQKCA